ncbi:MAG: glutamine--fructose-6-phosphate transaminase (isomerizing) [Deinococcus-Thermus bacterium]|jgi:glucosamine--fructose-6-phosphate aminotransferase (isomerizing)|nr:glutamine--fructose-6-phosphate transaminase (isomerizing) [Deinococcota bacterium]
MCGIVGYVGPREAAPVVLDGLRRLEYRGYDSAGLVSASPSGLRCVKRAGKLAVLQDALEEGTPAGSIGFGHTRWATHGRPSDANAHPHLSEDGRVAVVHNGIIENYPALRERLRAAGHVFASETDSEVLVHLVEEHWRGDLAAAVRAALTEVEGAFAVVCMHADAERLVAARRTSPLVIGLGEGETFLASDVPALLPHTKRVAFLRDDEVAELARGGVTVTDLEGAARPLRTETVAWSAEAAEKGGWPHYMLKEIYEQPEVVRQTVGGRFTEGGDDVALDLKLDPAEIDRVVIVAAGTASYAGLVGETLLERLARVPAEIDRVVIVAAGTASYAGLVGETLLERLARVPAEVEVASEFRYREPVLDERTLVVAVSQSGETIDTLQAVREAKRAGARTLGVLNVKGSSIHREVDDVLPIHAGPEIGVASTKAYTAMLAAFVLLAVRFGRARGTLDADRARDLTDALRAAPEAVARALGRRDEVRAVAAELAAARSVLYLGRGVNVASAYEGALKLKEISYLHAEAYPTGEMKHGPIALIDAATPVVALAPQGPLHAKTISNLQEVRARDGRVIAIASEGDEEIAAHADRVLSVPVVPDLLSPLVVAVPMQLLAYEVAVHLGRDVDQPRNLAKSVTVE